MSHTVTLEEAQARLADLIEHLGPGDEIVILREGQPMARIVPPGLKAPRPQYGSCKGMLTIVSDDNEHLEDFKEYMP